MIKLIIVSLILNVQIVGFLYDMIFIERLYLKLQKNNLVFIFQDDCLIIQK